MSGAKYRYLDTCSSAVPAMPPPFLPTLVLERWLWVSYGCSQRQSPLIPNYNDQGRKEISTITTNLHKLTFTPIVMTFHPKEEYIGWLTSPKIEKIINLNIQRGREILSSFNTYISWGQLFIWVWITFLCVDVGLACTYTKQGFVIDFRRVMLDLPTNGCWKLDC